MKSDQNDNTFTLPPVEHEKKYIHYEGMKTVGYRGGSDPDQPDYAQELAAELRNVLQGEVRFDAGSRATYSTDASNYRQVPIGVVLPKNENDVLETVRLCHQYGAPITSRGGGTSLAGQTCNVAVIMDFSKYMDKVLSIDPDTQTAVVQPGCILDTLRFEAQEKYNLTYGPDPATHMYNTLGGMIGNNSCGIHSVMAEFYGHGPLTVHQVESLDIVTYDGVRMTVGATTEEELYKIIKEGGRRGEIYAGLKAIRDRYAKLIREKFPQIPRRVSGFNLDFLLPEHDFNVAQALVGSEGTCVVVLSAKVKLQHYIKERVLLVLGYPSAYEAGDHVPEVMKHKPTGCEGIDHKLIGYMEKKGMHPKDIQMLPEGKGFLFVEFGDDTKKGAEAQARKLMDELKGKDDAPSIKLFTKEWEKKHLWNVREAGLGATARVPGMAPTHPGWEDAAVAPKNVGKYLREFRDLLDEFGYDCSLYGHFGQGCIHCRIDFDLSSAQGVKQWMAFLERAAHLVVKYGGSLSGEHGDGQARASLLPIMYGDELVRAFGEFKGIWDPQHKMNPHKVVEPYQPDENLRMGPDYLPKQEKTYFQYPDDDFSFANAVSRCVGVGKCRSDEGGTMCPSYMVTREEEDSTRGRSRLLFEMLRGDVLPDGWHDEHVKESLELCLACKACKNECPVNVDMATYKAEFLAHYYKGKLRPMPAYTMGLIYWWARIAKPIAPIANFFTQTEPFATLIKKAGGLATKRKMPIFAEQSFVDWFRARAAPFPPDPVPGRPSEGENKELHHEDVPRFQEATYESESSPHNDDGKRLNVHAEKKPFTTKRVLLWPDTFNNYLLPEAAKAAVEVLERAGYTVEIPQRPLCCGRPLYDFGMLDAAKRLWVQTLEHLRPYLRDGVPIVGLEPSCVAAFRDELINLFPHDEDAKRLAHSTFMLSEYLVRQQYVPPQLHRKAVVHGHCQHKAIMHMDAELAILKQMGVEYDLLDSGCCGMAGSFGFSADKYDISIRAGERVLLPKVREADDDTLVITNGFSCREQIEQQTERGGMHLAQVIQMALHEGPAGAAGDFPEKKNYNKKVFTSGSKVPLLALVGIGILAGVTTYFLHKNRNA